MKILLLLLVLGLLVSPALAALPGPEQKRRERLRRWLMENGVSVRLSAGLQKTESGDSAWRRNTARCSLPLSAPVCIAPGVALREGDGWSIRGMGAAGERRGLEEILQTIPRAVDAVEITPHDAAVYWREQGAQQDAEQLRRALLALQNLCAGNART